MARVCPRTVRMLGNLVPRRPSSVQPVCGRSVGQAVHALQPSGRVRHVEARPAGRTPQRAPSQLSRA
eukprot:6890588-Prymnesium_polylepis.1